MATTDIETIPAATGGGSMIEVASSRQAQEVQAAMAIAKRCPRDETASIARITRACKRPALADQAAYEYARGGTKITGPSIRLAEVLAQCWGNLDYGIVELEQRAGESDMLSYCWDLETNTRVTKIFTVRHERHKKDKRSGTVTVTQLTDPRDIYEVGANYGARRVRACILGVIPGDIQDEAVAECERTLEGDKKAPLIDRVRKMVVTFGDMGIAQDVIERRLGHSVEACSERGIARLRRIYQSLKDGMSTREDWFDIGGGDDLAAKLKDPEDPAPPHTESAAPPASEVQQEPPAAEGNGDTEAQKMAEEYYVAIDSADTTEAVDKLVTHAKEPAIAVVLGDAGVAGVMSHGKRRKNEIKRKEDNGD